VTAVGVGTGEGGIVGNKKLLAGAAALLSASLLFAGCGTRNEPAPGGASTDKVVKIGIIAPLTGDLAPFGAGIKNSVELAIKQANDSKAIPGWKIVLDAQDDTATPDVGANAATKLAADKEIAAIVGTLNSGVAQSVQPILSAAKIAMVSPANTGVSLTMGADPAKPKRVYPNYFRVCTNDAVQGPFAAQYAWESGVKKVAVVNDKKPYGQGLAMSFAAKFKELGGEIVADETVNKDDKDFSTVIDLIKPKSPEMVYFGTEFQLAGPFSKQLHDKGVKAPVMGGDGIFDAKYVTLAGSKSTGDLATSVGAPIESLESGKSFVDAYKAAGYKDGWSAYGAYSYDATNAIIAALKVSLPNATDATAARQATVDALAKVSFDGVTGKVAFDEFGDATTKTLTVYTVADGKWTAKQTGELK
jgi:branched-chain amino acid transport system substrate-binding protein